MAAGKRVLTDETIEAVKAYFPRYPNRRAVVLPALHLIQERLGCVSPEAVVELAELLGLAPAELIGCRRKVGVTARRPLASLSTPPSATVSRSPGR